MTALDGYTGETEFTRVDVEINDDDPDEWPTIGALHGDMINEQSIVLSMDEARHVIAGLATVVR